MWLDVFIDRFDVSSLETKVNLKYRNFTKCKLREFNDYDFI